MGAAAGGARRREQPGGGARERAPLAPAPRPLPCRSPPSSAAGSRVIPGPRFRVPGPRHGSLSAPIPRPLPPGPRGGQAAVWDAEGVAGSGAPSAPPSPALPVRERGVRRDPERCGYKGAGPSPPALRGGGKCRAAGARAKFARKRKEDEKQERRTIVRGPGGARPPSGRDGCWGKGGSGHPPSGPFSHCTAECPPPNFAEGRGLVGRGRSPGLESQGLSWAGAPAGALMIPGEPVEAVEAGDQECVLEVGGEAVQGSESGGIGRGEVFRGADTPSGVWGGTGQVCILGVVWSLGTDRGERGCVLLEDGAGGQGTRALCMGAQGQAPASLSPLRFTPLGGWGLCISEF